MNRLPQVTARELLAAPQRGGFVVDRIKRSYHFLQHKDDATRRTVIALHSGDIPQGTLRDIRKPTSLSRESFLKLL
jgi:predicted RNA binding protein YcfA (HicA-like mRNA interferase family)